MTKFCYQTSSVEVVAAHFVTLTRQAIWLVKNYYKNDSTTLEKLLQAEKLAKVEIKKKKLQQKLEELQNAG